MIAALVTVEVHVPGVASLKGKRGIVKPLIKRLQRDLNVSVAEIGHQDLWQRATLGVAIAAGSESGARKVAQQVERLVYDDLRVQVISIDVDVVEPEY